MKLILMLCTVVTIYFFYCCNQFVAAAATVGGSGTPAVGLYAPNRYDGIDDACLLPMDFGYCRAKVKRYYFDMRRMKCNMFYFGGCAGNVNNFKSLDECTKTCLDSAVVDTKSRSSISTADSNGNSNQKNYLNNLNNRSGIKAAKNKNGSNNDDNVYAASEDYDEEE